VRLQRLPVTVGEDAVIAEREEERLDVDTVAEGEAALHVDVPVLGDDLFVPVIDLVEHLPTD